MSSSAAGNLPRLWQLPTKHIQHFFFHCILIRVSWTSMSILKQRFATQQPGCAYNPWDQLSRRLSNRPSCACLVRKKATPRLRDPQQVPLVDELPLQQQVQEQSSAQQIAKERPARAKHNPTLPTPTKNNNPKPEASPVATAALITNKAKPCQAETIGDPVIVENLQLWPTPKLQLDGNRMDKYWVVIYWLRM